MTDKSTTESIYELLTNVEDARVCKDISDDACREVPGNFLLMILTHFLTKLGDAVVSPKIVLPWVLATIQAPVFLTAFLVPIRESGSLIPQLMIASYIRRLPVRKWVWVWGSVAQAIAMAGIGWVAFSYTGEVAGWLVVALLAAFSLARGFCSVASKDVLGKTVPKTKRGQATGLSASAAGFVTIALGAVLMLMPQEAFSAGFYGGLIAAAGALWLLAAVIYGLIREYPGETGGGGNALSEAIKRSRILWTDAPFRRFVLARALLLSSALSAPYLVVLAQQRSEHATALLGLFLVASGAASFISSPVWGRMSDVSSRRVMVIGALMASVLGTVVFVVDQIMPGLIGAIWFMPLAYVVLSVSHDGIRVGRKTYVVDLAGGNKRTDYVAVSNSVIGVILLVTGSVGALSTFMPISGIIMVLSVAGFAGAWMSLRLPEVE